MGVPAGQSAILVSGSLAFDEVFLYDGEIRCHLPTDRNAPLYVNLRSSGPIRRFGGCGGNVAYTLSLLGAPVTLDAWIGDDGASYLDHLAGLGIDVSRVVRRDDLPTPSGALMVDSRGDQILFFGDQGRRLELPIPRLDGAALAVVTAGVPAHMLGLMERCSRSKTPVVADPGKIIMDVEADRIIHALHGADTLLLNEYERDLLIRRSGVSWERIIEPVDAAVVTSGPGGVAVETAGGITAVPAVTADAVDPNGAGDAFLAGYAFGRYRELPPLWCARLGATAAAFTVEAAGTQGHRFTLDEFHTRLIRYFGPEAEKLL